MQQPMQPMYPPPPGPPKKGLSNTAIIWIIVAVLGIPFLCGLITILVLIGVGPQIGSVFSAVEKGLDYTPTPRR